MFLGVHTVAVLAGLAVLLAACGAAGVRGTSERAPGPMAVPVSVQSSGGPVTIVKGRSPAQLYSHVARQVRACWFNPRNPLLKGYVFHGEAGAGGRSGTATNIEIYTETRDEKRGLKAFSIDFVDERVSTRVVAENHKLPAALGSKFIADVGSWAQGGTNCNGRAQAAVPAVSR